VTYGMTYDTYTHIYIHRIFTARFFMWGSLRLAPIRCSEVKLVNWETPIVLVLEPHN